MSAKRIDLPECNGQEPQVGLFYTMRQELRRRVKAAAADLNSQQLAWRPEPGGGGGGNSIGELLLHIAEAELFWIQWVCLGEELTTEQHEQFRTELFGQPQAPPLAEQPIEWFGDKLDEVTRTTTAFYTTLTDLSLDEVRRYADDEGREYEFTVRWILYHLLEHEAGHRAQILTLCRLLPTEE